jgi:hypothetical protein
MSHAALSSALVVVHMVRRRRLPDADRLVGLRVRSAELVPRM